MLRSCSSNPFTQVCEVSTVRILAGCAALPTAWTGSLSARKMSHAARLQALRELEGLELALDEATPPPERVTPPNDADGNLRSLRHQLSAASAHERGYARYKLVMSSVLQQRTAQLEHLRSRRALIHACKHSDQARDSGIDEWVRKQRLAREKRATAAARPALPVPRCNARCHGRPGPSEAVPSQRLRERNASIRDELAQRLAEAREVTLDVIALEDVLAQYKVDEVRAREALSASDDTTAGALLAPVNIGEAEVVVAAASSLAEARRRNATLQRAEGMMASEVAMQATELSQLEADAAVMRAELAAMRAVAAGSE